MKVSETKSGRVFTSVYLNRRKISAGLNFFVFFWGHMHSAIPYVKQFWDKVMSAVLNIPVLITLTTLITAEQQK